MLAFEVSLNGKKTVLAGFEDWEILHAILTAQRAGEKISNDEMDISVSGLAQSRVVGQLEHERWGRLSLSVGDEVTIRLVEVSRADTPKKRYRSDKSVQENPFTDEEMYEYQKKDYQRLKKIFEGQSEK